MTHHSHWFVDEFHFKSFILHLTPALMSAVAPVWEWGMNCSPHSHVCSSKTGASLSIHINGWILQLWKSKLPQIRTCNPKSSAQVKDLASGLHLLYLVIFQTNAHCCFPRSLYQSTREETQCSTATPTWDGATGTPRVLCPLLFPSSFACSRDSAQISR